MEPIVGHEATIELLRRGLASGRIAHAYLFTGPPAIGKFALAKGFAQALNCAAATDVPAPESSPRLPACGRCRACRLIAEDRHPDVRVVRMAEDRREISIEQIRTLQHEAALKPYEARWKVYVVRDAETMSEEAANCLLKTLEEPAPQVVILLTAPTPEALLPTIVSRCQPMPMHPLPTAQVEAALRDWHACEAERARLLARLSAGRIGWAIQAARDETILAQRNQLLSRLVALTAATRVERLAFAAEQAQRYGKDLAEREAVHGVLDLWVAWWRDVMLLKQGCTELAINADRLERLHQEAQRHSLAEVRAFLESLRQSGEQLRQNVNPRLALEALLLVLPRGT